MLERLSIKNLTVFPKADLEFAPNLNVIVGENGTGKTHLLKIAYTVLAVSAEQRKKATDTPLPPSKEALQIRLSDKLVGVFRPERLGNLVHRKHETQPCTVGLEFADHQMDITFNFGSQNESSVRISKLPTTLSEPSPAYLPTRELLTIYPNFVSVYENHYLNFEETWRDACILLGGLVERGRSDLLGPLEDAMGGAIELDRSGRFYLNNVVGRLEISLVAEGLRKLGMLAQLIATGVFTSKGYLFWDEPEANLNPKLVQRVAGSILSLSKAGIQVFIATHSLFLLRELEILLATAQFTTLNSKFFGLHKSGNRASVQQGKTIDDIGDIAALDETLRQSDRFLAKD